MNWQKEYKSRFMSFEDAVKLIQDGDTVQIGFGPGAPSAPFFDAFLERADTLKNVRVMDAMPTRKMWLYDPEIMEKLKGHITYAPMFATAFNRNMFKTGLAKFSGGIADYSDTRVAKAADYFIFQVTPPNAHGMVNVGTCCMFHKNATILGRKNHLRTVIAQVNDQMPVVNGDTWLPISAFDGFVEYSEPLPEYGRATPDEFSKIIGGHVLNLIEDGCTIQMGAGTITEAVIAGLDSFKNLGCHSEMFPMGLQELVEKGVITNVNKPAHLHRGKSIAAFCLGSRAMYDYVAENPDVELYSSGYTNSVALISQMPKMRSINQAIFVDLTGQICAEGVGHEMISGPGGQLDFQMGAWFSEGGIAMTLIAAGKKDKKTGEIRSSIVTNLPVGTPITVSRNVTDRIITEYGVAELRDKTLEQRVHAMIAIAHPDLRDKLLFEAKKAGLLN